ncbi:hypothetical protein CONLIGDRAFT_687744 [Coniochaeta ligniaria NRRL 30616]|uniref:Peptidase S1 domain-containing protein n=1 Tax=Coniochaeta ligniaria NRRL 30616 TaxID=1408157 RepID=A0A1J7IZC0_9PEZI|nr:hypothetical protein CONLIGDRAFT_687744 [Coniochaeta ligniaria NRRL 30616]
MSSCRRASPSTSATDGYTEDRAVVEIHRTIITEPNFIGNAIKLGSGDVDVLTSWKYPDRANPRSFDYTGNRLLHFAGTGSDEEMRRPPPGTKGQDDDALTMVHKNGNTSCLTVGRLNDIRSFSGAFSAPGDSRSAVVDGKRRVCGILTGGDEATDVSDITVVTSINFILKRLGEHGIKANILPTLANP